MPIRARSDADALRQPFMVQTQGAEGEDQHGQDDQHGGDHGDRDDSVAEGEARSAFGERMWQVAIARQQREQTRKVGKAGVSSHDQQQQRANLQQRMRRACPDQGPRQLAVERLGLGRIGHDADPGCEKADPDKERAEADGECDEPTVRILDLRFLVVRHAVRHGLDSRQRHRARRKRAQDQQQAERRRWLTEQILCCGWWRIWWEGAAGPSGQAIHDDGRRPEDVAVDRKRKEDAGRPNTAQVGDHDQRERDQREWHMPWAEQR